MVDSDEIEKASEALADAVGDFFTAGFATLPARAQVKLVNALDRGDCVIQLGIQVEPYRVAAYAAPTNGDYPTLLFTWPPPKAKAPELTAVDSPASTVAGVTKH